MSRRTKSFFEQPELNHHPRQFNRQYRPYEKRDVLAARSPNVAAPSLPPVVIAEQTKNKLKAYNFDGSASMNGAQQVPGGNDNACDSHTLPNKLSAKPEDVHPMEDQQEARGVSEQSRIKKAPLALPHANTFPSTPGDRLTLDELIGHVQDDGQVEDLEGPEEILGWNPNSSCSGGSPSRKRKRAQSSSPELPSASADRLRNAQKTTQSKVQQTPTTDPATELWRRFGGYDKRSAGTHGLPDINLDFQASPRQLETPVKSAGFRRWASTGNEWPSSKSKRQRIGLPADASVWSNGPSKVAAMVEKMLALQHDKQPAARRMTAKDPSSSSPLPETGAEISPRRLVLNEQANKIYGATSLDAPLTKQAAGLSNKRTLSHSPDSSRRAGCDRNVAKRDAAVKPPAAPQRLRTPDQQNGQHRRSQSRATHLVAPMISANNADEFATDITLDDLVGLSTSPRPKLEDSLRSENEPFGVPEKITGHESVVESNDVLLGPDDFDDDMRISDDDEFGLSEVDEQSFITAELTATQVLTTRSPTNRTRSNRLLRQSSPSLHPCKPAVANVQASPESKRRYRRLRVDRVLRSELELILQCSAEDSQQTLAVSLFGSWTSTSIASGDIIHIAPHPACRDAVLERKAPGQIELNDSEQTPLLIVHPDYMLSATTVADAFDCVRKAVLQDRIKVTGETSKAMVYGKILHAVFQQALLANTWHEKYLHELASNTVRAHVEAIWELGMKDDVQAVEDITAKMAELSAWAQVFVRNSPSADARFSSGRDDSLRIAITGLIAIEEHVWSPMFGLKGNVDATVQVVQQGNPSKTVLAPFEVKTGRTSNAPTHHAQTSMYTLLMSDRYDIPVKAGILYYLESSNISDVRPSMTEIRLMIQQRNRVAHYIHMAKHPSLLIPASSANGLEPSQPMAQTGLPPMMKAPFKCGRCYAQQSCFTFHALCEDGTADSAGMIDDKQKNHSMIWKENLGHLLAMPQPGQKAEGKLKQDMIKAWFSKWDRLLTYEEHEGSKIRKELWTMSSSVREGIGRGFADLRLCQDLTAAQDLLSSTAIDGIDGSNGKIHRYVYVFERRSTASTLPFNASALPFNENTQLTVGEPVVVSSEAGQWALAIGYVISATQKSITIAVDRKLGSARERVRGFDEEVNQTYEGIMQINDGVTTSLQTKPDQTYRLDKDEFSNGLSKVRASLVRMMSSHPIHTRLRELVIFGAAPVFSDAPMPQHLPPSQLGEMNEDQKAAANKVTAAEDYALVLGMPGTGKTTTIAHLIRTLLADGKSILLTSYTHTAVDNILLKIRDIVPASGILRFGMPAKVHPAVREFCHLANSPRDSVEEINQVYLGTQIVATTCMGTNHALFTQRIFDVCIVDEASQITLPISMAPLLCARKFILVGDHYQLPPLVQNQAALDGGLDMSLFRLLCEQQPQAIVSLGKQYRMCKEIMSISNTLIYDGRLESGNAEVAERSLQIPADRLSQCPPGSQGCHGGAGCWLEDACKPDRKVLFLNTDPIGASAREVLLTSSKNITNRLEGVLTTQLVLALQALGITSRDLGVITLYRSQIAYIRRLFKNASVSRDVELDSADRYQGRDKDCIIISMVRSNESGIVGDLIKDWRRLNVAFTRARCKLIVIGSRQTLANNELMKGFLRLTDDNGWTVDLPVDAETSHYPATSTLGTGASPPQQNAPITKTLPPVSPSVVHSRLGSSPASRQALQESLSAGNRGSRSGAAQPMKVIRGHQSVKLQRKAQLKEQLAFEIMEDLMAEDWS